MQWLKTGIILYSGLNLLLPNYSSTASPSLLTGCALENMEYCSTVMAEVQWVELMASQAAQHCVLVVHCTCTVCMSNLLAVA